MFPPGTVFGVPGEWFLTAFFQKQAQKIQKLFKMFPRQADFSRARSRLLAREKPFPCDAKKRSQATPKSVPRRRFLKRFPWYHRNPLRSRSQRVPESFPGNAQNRSLGTLRIVPWERSKSFPGNARNRSQGKILKRPAAFPGNDF